MPESQSSHPQKTMASRSNIDLQELSKHFGSPEKEVAKSLGMCLTSLKKICRQHGINRWPYRKIKSLDVKLKKLEVAMSTTKEDPSMVYAQWATTASESSSSSSGSHTPSSATSELCSMASTPRQQSVENMRMPSPEPADVGPRVETWAQNMAVLIESEEHGFRPATPQPPSLISAPISMPYVKDDSNRDDRSPSPEAGQSDEDIIAMLAECAGTATASAPAFSEPPCHASDFKQDQQQLSDGDIMEALASCCALPCMEDEELDSCQGSDAEGDAGCGFGQPAFQSIDPDSLVGIA